MFRIARRRALGIAFVLCSIAAVSGSQWDLEGARRAWEEAIRQKTDLSTRSAPSRNTYLRAIQAFQQVYFKDPHYINSDDAVFEAAKLCQKMGDAFRDAVSYRNAVRLYRFLLSDYGNSPFCAEALLQVGTICSGPLEDAQAGREAFDRLLNRYPGSSAAAVLAEKNNSKPASSAAGPLPMAAQTSQAGLAQSDAAAKTEVLIKGITFASGGESTRVNIVTDGKAIYSKALLSDPERVYFDIPNAKLRDDRLYENLAVGDRFVRQVRVARTQAGMVRVVIDLTDSGPFSVSDFSEAFGVTVEIRGKAAPPGPAKTLTKPGPAGSQTVAAEKPGQPPPAANPAKTSEAGAPAAIKDASGKDKAGSEKLSPPEKAESEKVTKEAQPAAAAVKNAPPGSPALKEPPKSNPPAAPVIADNAPQPKAARPTSAGTRTMTRTLGLKIGRIVLDPGHGGHDAGTIGPGGLTEKELVLGLAKELQKLLEEQLGATVILTRSDDRFVSLEERTQIANQHQADLFISLHANSSASRSISGVETYYLDFARNDDARDVASRENASSDRNIRDLEQLVQKIAKADKRQESKELASNVQKSLFAGARKIIPQSKNRGVRSAPFVVLIGAHMPSILAEIAFLSNPQDEKTLAKQEARQSLAAALLRGIQAYMDALGSSLAQNRGKYN